MKNSYEIVRLVEAFWKHAGRSPKPPYDIEGTCSRILPLSLSSLPNITDHSVVQWLRNIGIELPLTKVNRSLRGCVIAFRGHGFLFFDCLDSRQEQRFTIAHEIGHFLVDYLIPRKNATRKLGNNVTEILDGFRQPFLEERAYALLSDVTLPMYRHSSTRKEELLGCGYSNANSELLADQLAIELLAPEPQVHRLVRPARERKFLQVEFDIRTALETTFGLPESIATNHAYNLAMSWTSGPSIKEWFGLT